jgi:hypothetical protein
MGSNILVHVIKEVLFMPWTTQYTCTPLLGYPINILGSITYIWNLEGYYIALAKPRRKTITASLCNNIIKQIMFCKFLFHAYYLMLDILIQINESIAKLFTLIIKRFTWTKLWNLNVILASYWDICIHCET